MALMGWATHVLQWELQWEARIGKAERIRKDCRRADCSLQLGNMKLESLVIADQHAAVNMYPGPVHTARHTLGIGFARSIDASHHEPMTSVTSATKA